MAFLDSIPTHMDYQGQKFAENFYQIFIVIVAIIGFIVGYIFQQLSYSMFILGGGCLVGALITLPPWPMYRKNPIRWQTPVENAEAKQTKSKK